MKNIGIALGGGGVRGLVHALALEALDDSGVKLAAISGTSIGGIIGTLYASGKSGREIRELLTEKFISKQDPLNELYQKRTNLFQWFKAVRPSWDNSGLISAKRFLDYLLPDLDELHFEDLEIPLRVVATDFHDGKQVVFDRGELLPALRASMSIPGVFVPTEHDGHLLIDGGVVNNLPYDVLPKECDITIAIDIVPVREYSGVTNPSLVEMTLGTFDIMLERITSEKLELSPPDIYIPVEFRGIRTLDFGKAIQVWEQGAPAIDDLRAKLELLRIED